jgi:hypothetical protein
MARRINSNQSCVHDAFVDAGLDPHGIPTDGVDPQDLHRIAQERGMNYLENGTFQIGEEPVIAIYGNSDGTTNHAVYHESPAQIRSDRPLNGLITRLFGR